MVYPSNYDITLLNKIILSKKAKDLTNLIFGRLVALFPIENTGNTNKGTVIWLCKCSCGNYTSIRGTLLTDNIIVSCGCQGRESRAKANKRDVSGQKFNRLTAIEPT